MRVELRKRYYCDHCKKAGGSSGHMKRHEAGCTANPARVCGVCRAAGISAQPLPDLIALARKLATWHVGFEEEGPAHGSLDAEAMKALREAADNCPACILAALRQSRCGSSEFQFKSELLKLWAEVNEAKADGEEYGY